MLLSKCLKRVRSSSRYRKDHIRDSSHLNKDSSFVQAISNHLKDRGRLLVTSTLTPMLSLRHRDTIQIFHLVQIANLPKCNLPNTTSTVNITSMEIMGSPCTTQTRRKLFLRKHNQQYVERLVLHGME